MGVWEGEGGKEREKDRGEKEGKRMEEKMARVM